MSAPLIGGNWQRDLRALKEGWDCEGGKPITMEAIRTVERFATVPCFNGGIQFEIHRDGIDLEIQIEPDGKISSVLVCPASKIV